MMDQVRNVVELPDGRIDCEVDHPVLGWIPYTASADDCDKTGRDVFAVAAIALQNQNP